MVAITVVGSGQFCNDFRQFFCSVFNRKRNRFVFCRQIVKRYGVFDCFHRCNKRYRFFAKRIRCACFVYFFAQFPTVKCITCRNLVYRSRKQRDFAGLEAFRINHVRAVAVGYCYFIFNNHSLGNCVCRITGAVSSRVRNRVRTCAQSYFIVRNVNCCAVLRYAYVCKKVFIGVIANRCAQKIQRIAVIINACVITNADGRFLYVYNLRFTNYRIAATVYRIGRTSRIRRAANIPTLEFITSGNDSKLFSRRRM